jgi:hypothetical protein
LLCFEGVKDKESVSLKIVLFVNFVTEEYSD